MLAADTKPAVSLAICLERGGRVIGLRLKGASHVPGA